MNLDLPENFESIIYLDFFLSDKRNDNLNTVAPEEFVSSFFILSYRTRLKVFYAEVKEFFNPWLQYLRCVFYDLERDNEFCCMTSRPSSW